jgi:hypothetical protein
MSNVFVMRQRQSGMAQVVLDMEFLVCPDYDDLYAMESAGKRQIGLHVAFSIGVLSVLFVSRYEYLGMPKDQRGWTTILSYPFFLACIYLGRWFCLKWFSQHRPPGFLLYSIPGFLGILLLWYFFIKTVFSLPNLGFFEFSLAYGPFFIIGLTAGFLVKLVRASQQKQVQDARIKAEQKESELNLLQSQLSPHFLFNTLNNLYGISIADHQRIPALLLKLSDLLRYSVYNTKKTFVPLKDELDYISNYIAFEKMRISDRLVLNEAIGPVTADIRIAPMVLIVFVENAFKHAKDTLEQKIHITIHLKISGNFIVFTISNSYRKEKEGSGLLNESSGLGLANTIKRLDLLYGADYEMKTFVRDELYHAHLQLKLM